MNRVLFLVHRIPFPPNKGDKIRSFNLLKQLAKNHEVHLGAFVDDAADWRHEPDLGQWCADCFLRPLRPRARKLASLAGLVTGQPLTVPYYRDRSMAAWVHHKCIVEGIDQVVVFSSAMAQYVLGPQMESLTRIVDLVDVDSEKWRAYAPRHRWPMDWVYKREADLLLAYERKVAQNCDAVVLVSPQEAQLFRELAPESSDRIHAVHNGVDADYFSPDHSFENPYSSGDRVLVFTGAMDYWANVDAVTWFAESIYPQIRSEEPSARFYIVGARPTDQVRKLGRIEGVTVTGAVHDIRPYLAHSLAAVAPLRIARGIQNKVLEAMAMARPVLGTQAAMEGIEIPSSLEALVCNEPADFVSRALALLHASGGDGSGKLGRETVLREYSWTESFSRFEQLLAECRPSRSGQMRVSVAAVEGTAS